VNTRGDIWEMMLDYDTFWKKKRESKQYRRKKSKVPCNYFLFFFLGAFFVPVPPVVNLSTGFGLDRSEYGVDSDRPTTLIMSTLENTNMTIRAG
jgi:hypothetical protein